MSTAEQVYGELIGEKREMTGLGRDRPLAQLLGCDLRQLGEPLTDHLGSKIKRPPQRARGDVFVQHERLAAVYCVDDHRVIHRQDGGDFLVEGTGPLSPDRP